MIDWSKPIVVVKAKNDKEIPYGYCHCGCGFKAGISRRNNSTRGSEKGKPNKYINGHGGVKFGKGNSPSNARLEGNPNPSGLCMCGCGQKTTIAAKGSIKSGTVKGKPRRFIYGHHSGGRSNLASDTTVILEAYQKVFGVNRTNAFNAIVQDWYLSGGEMKLLNKWAEVSGQTEGEEGEEYEEYEKSAERTG